MLKMYYVTATVIRLEEFAGFVASGGKNSLDQIF